MMNGTTGTRTTEESLDACLIDDGNGPPYDLLELNDEGDLILENNSTTSSNSSSSDEVEIEINALVTPTNDKQDSGIDDKDSSPPTNPASPKETITVENTMVYDIREKETKPLVKDTELVEKRSLREKRLSDIKDRERKRADENAEELKNKPPYRPNYQKRNTFRGNFHQAANNRNKNNRRSAQAARKATDSTWVEKKKSSPRQKRQALNSTWPNMNQAQTRFQNSKFGQGRQGSPPKKKGQGAGNKKRHNSLEDHFENLRVTVSPGKNKRSVNSANQEEKKIAGEVLMGLINPNAKSPKSKASRTILGLLNPSKHQNTDAKRGPSVINVNKNRRQTLDTAWMELFTEKALHKPKHTRRTLNTTWMDTKENRKSPNQSKGSPGNNSLSEKFGKIQKEKPKVVSKFNEWKKRQTLEATWQ